MKTIGPKSLISLLICSSHEAYGFGLPKHRVALKQGNDVNTKTILSGGSTTTTTTAAILSSFTLPYAVMAADAEISELPPPYIPVAVGFGLLIAVGVLTSSLGDVLAEEASLGELSGARAKKEMERSRSSYFKK